jgi:2-hydroxychromene-2-carboxylate isomerase
VLIEYWFDFSCPYAYLGSERIEALAERTGAELRWKPMLLGGVFKAIGNHEDDSAPGKRANNYRDMHRWAEVHDIPFAMPPGHPMRTVAALRALLSLPEERWPAVIHGFYRAYWRRGLNPGDPATIRGVLAEAGCDEAAITRALAANEDGAIKDELRRRTDEAVARGVFGAPTMFVSGGDLTEPLMFWGQDRFDMVEEVVRGWRPGVNAPRPQPQAPAGSAADATVDFWFDFSSPFAYLGSTQIESICARHGATLRWRPMLLGALFKEVGAPNVPLLAMSENKRRYLGRELDYWASWWQVPFAFTRHFPLRTILPLRLALVAAAQPAPVIHALYRAAWADNADVGSDAAAAEVLKAAGLDPALIAGTQDPAIKKQLADDTAAAGAAGVFGAPTTIIQRPGEAPLLFWGQDRLTLVDRALGGWSPKIG